MKNSRYILKDNKGFQNLVPMALVIIILFAILFVGIFIMGEVDDSLVDSLPENSAGNWRDNQENTTLFNLRNVSEDFDSTLDILQIVVIISILAIAIGAIFLFTRFR
jgi:hypothetical protein